MISSHSASKSFTRSLAFAAAVALGLGFASTAASAQGTSTGNSMQSRSSTTGAAQGKSEKTFLTKAIQGNYAEIAMGKLAEQKGHSSGVKSFGQTLVTDHSAANEKAINLAKEMNVTPPTGPNKTQKAEHDKLAKMSGAAFDKAFVQAMVKDHKTAIELFQKEAKMKGDVAQFASATLPTLHEHLQMAQKLEKGNSTATR